MDCMMHRSGSSMVSTSFSKRSLSHQLQFVEGNFQFQSVRLSPSSFGTGKKLWLAGWLAGFE